MCKLTHKQVRARSRKALLQGDKLGVTLLIRRGYSTMGHRPGQETGDREPAQASF